MPALLTILFLCGLTETESGTARNDRPSFVIVVADDLGYRDVGCYGCVDFETPNIDALASDGVRFTNGYVSHPYCSPSRAGILTGQYQQRFGHEHNPPYRETDSTVGIDVDTRLLPDILRSHGYATGLIGKWHLGAGKPFRPIARGFSEFYGFLGGGHHYFQVRPNGKGYNSPMWRDGKPTADTLTYLTDDLTKEAEAFIDRHSDQPFCLFVMYNAPHAPDHVTERYLGMVEKIEHEGRRRYAALVRGVDEGVGRIRARLEKRGLTHRTMMVFLSDNGGRRALSDNRPLRGNKGWLHEGGIRVPFVVSHPGVLPAGKVYHHPVIALDLLPTALAAADIELPARLDGVDLRPQLLGQVANAPHATLHWRVSGGDGYAIRHGPWKLVHDVAMDRAALYDLSQDMAEDHDLSAEHAEVVARLKEAHRVWAAELEKPRWTEAHTLNTTKERARAREAQTRQYPMPWIE